MEWTMEMQMVVAELTEQYVEFGEGCEDACAHCPYAAQCHAAEGWWGCGAWEEGMGEDL